MAPNISQQVVKRVPAENLQGKKAHFNAIAKFKLPTTFWGKSAGPDSRLKVLSVDYTTLEKKFFEEKKVEDLKKVSNVQVKAPVFTLMDASKLLNINIVLTSFTQPLNEVVEILIKCSDTLAVEQLSKLLTILPADDDRKKFVEFKDEITKLTNVEQFIKKLVDIPRLKQRLEAMIFKNNYAGDLEDFRVKSEDLHEPFIVLKTCTKFQNVLKFILEIFNFLNHGTTKANQAGFTVEALNSLESLKAFDKTTTMVMFIVENIRVKK